MSAAIGSVRAIFSASTGGLVRATGEAGAALRKLGVDMGGLHSALRLLGGMSAGNVGEIGPAAEKSATVLRLLQGRMEGLSKQLDSGAITAEQYAQSMARVNQLAAEQASRLSRGAEVTRANATAQERHSRAVAELNELLAAGAITQDVYNRALERENATLADANGEAAAARSLQESLAAAMREGAAVVRSVETAEERHGRRLSELNSLLVVGAIDQRTYARAVAQADDELRDEAASATRAAASTDRVADAVGRANGKLTALVAINAAQLLSSLASAAANAARSILSLGDREAEAIDQTSKLAARVGMTYGELQAIKLVEDDLSFETIVAGATKLDVALVRAGQGSKVAQQALAGLGLSVADLQGMTAADRFAAVASAIAGIPSEAERAAAAVRLFGRAGAAMLPLFNQGAGAIAEARQQAERLGLALTQDQTAGVQGMKDSFEKAGKAVTGIVQQVVAYLSPAVAEVMTTFTDLVGSIGGANIGQAIGQGILDGARYFAGVADAWLAGSTDVFAFVRSVGDYWGGVFDVGRRIGAVFGAAGQAMAFAFRSLAMAISGPVESLLKAAKTVADALGLSSGLLDSAVAAAGGFNDELARGARANLDAAVAGLDFATGPGQALGQAAAGPLTAAVDAAAARARSAAAGVDSVQRATFETGPAAAPAVAVSRSVSAVDSRSSEGVKEMFRLMRGGGDEVQERQLDALETIAENTSDMGVDVLELDFAR